MKNSALVTGGAKRLGKEICRALAAQGYDLAISYNNSKDEAEVLAKELSSKYQVNCQIFAADLCDLNQAQDLIDKVLQNFGNLNLLVNNASIFQRSKFLKSNQKSLIDNFNIHFFAPLLMARKFAQNFLEKELAQQGLSGHLINLIDKNIVRYDTAYFDYLLSKKSLAELTKVLALELAPNIRVNGIAPGFILDPIDNGLTEEEATRIKNRIPLQKKGEDKNIVQALEFLLQNDFVNGQIIFVDGAASLNNAG